MTTKLADTGAVTTGLLAAITWLPDLEVMLRICATTVAILAGICAGLYHFEAWRQKRKEGNRGYSSKTTE